MSHKHQWRYIDKCCAFCATCEAESYHGEIIEREGEL